MHLSEQRREPSLSHRKAEVRKDLWRSSGPALMFKQGHLELGAQDHVQTAFQYLQARRLHTSLQNLCQQSCLCHSKMCFLMFRRNLLCFSLDPLPLVLSLGTTKERLSVVFSSFIQVFINTDNIPLRIHFSRLKSSSLLRVFLYVSYSCSLCCTLSRMSMSLLY